MYVSKMGEKRSGIAGDAENAIESAKALLRKLIEGW